MADATIEQIVDELYRTESRRVFATLIRLLGDFDLAEEAMHIAFSSAVEQWSREGVPKNPRAWLVSAGRFRGIDSIRRRYLFDAALNEINVKLDETAATNAALGDADVEDDRLRLIFTCCHPALAPDVQVALTLREVCGLTTEQVASAFLVAPTTMAQRIVRGKTKIRQARIPYRVPNKAELPERLDSVLSVIYLVFNEGYSASSGESVFRAELSSEAITLARLLLQLLPAPETMGLLALMLLHDSRRAARTDSEGNLVLLENQNRELWNRVQIAEGKALVEQSLASRQFGAYTVQAAIAAVHADAPSTSQTDWTQIAALYDALLQLEPTPVVELNRAVAIAMRHGYEAGLNAIDAILARGELHDYHLIHAARADFLRRMGQGSAAKEAYEQALKLVKQEPERRFLERRLMELSLAANETRK